MPDSSLPLYVERGGELVGKGPFASQHVQMYWFILKASLPELSLMLSRYLNEPSKGAVDFRPVTPFVVLTFADIDDLQSEHPDEKELGAYSYHEAGIWTLALDVRRGTLSAFLPYVYVSIGQVMANGRELYGFPKQFANIKIDPPGWFSVDAVSIRKFEAGAEAAREPVIAVTGEDSGASDMRESFGEDAAVLLSRLLGLLFPNGRGIAGAAPLIPRAAMIPRVPAPTLTPSTRPRVVLGPANEANAPPIPSLVRPILAVGEIFRSIVEGEVPMVFLKQFRDVEDPRRACYQAIIEAPARLLNFDGGELLPDLYTVQVADLAGEPIRRELGLERGSFRPVASFRLKFGFRIEHGREIWRAEPSRAPSVRLSPGRG